MGFEYFRLGFGLVTEHDSSTENCNLFLAQHHLLKDANGNLSNEDVKWFEENMKLKINEKGLYNRRSEETTPVRSVSHDEILGWMISSLLLGTNHKDVIWKHLIRHFGAYNNTGRFSDSLPFNPGNFYTWGQICGSWFSLLFLPIFAVNLLLAINKEPKNTSSKIMYWMSFDAMPKTIINMMLFNIYDDKMKKQYGNEYVSYLLHFYHNAEKPEFPIFREL